MRLIDADEMAILESEAYMKVNTRADISVVTQGLNSVVHRKIQQLIANTPTVDAVPVVRCKECTHDGLSTCPMCYIEDKALVFVNHDPEFYCGKGERRDGDE